MAVYGHKIWIIISYHFYGFLWLRTNTDGPCDPNRRNPFFFKFDLLFPDLWHFQILRKLQFLSERPFQKSALHKYISRRTI